LRYREKAEGERMMNALHLIWIVPVAAVGGFVLAVLLAAGNDTKEE